MICKKSNVVLIGSALREYIAGHLVLVHEFIDKYGYINQFFLNVNTVQILRFNIHGLQVGKIYIVDPVPGIYDSEYKKAKKKAREKLFKYKKKVGNNI